MKNILNILFIAIFILASINLYGQNCEKDIHLTVCKAPTDKKFENTEKSGTYSFVMGKTNRIIFTLFGGKEYFFSLCSADRQVVSVRIREVATNEIIYDNRYYKMEQSLSFDLETTKELLFEFLVPKKSGNLQTKEFVCVEFAFYQK